MVSKFNRNDSVLKVSDDGGLRVKLFIVWTFPVLV